jgi:hypothetical protein
MSTALFFHYLSVKLNIIKVRAQERMRLRAIRRRNVGESNG